MAFREIQHRRGTDAQRLTITPKAGELFFSTDTQLLYVGDGSTAGGIAVGGGGGGSTDVLVVTANAEQVIESSASWTKIPFGNEVKRDAASFSYNIDGTVTFNFNGWVKVTYTVAATSPI